MMEEEIRRIKYYNILSGIGRFTLDSVFKTELRNVMKFILNKFLKKLSNLLSNTDSVKPHLEKLNGQVVELNVEGAG